VFPDEEFDEMIPERDGSVASLAAPQREFFCHENDL